MFDFLKSIGQKIDDLQYKAMVSSGNKVAPRNRKPKELSLSRLSGQNTFYIEGDTFKDKNIITVTSVVAKNTSGLHGDQFYLPIVYKNGLVDLQLIKNLISNLAIFTATHPDKSFIIPDIAELINRHYQHSSSNHPYVTTKRPSFCYRDAVRLFKGVCNCYLPAEWEAHL